MTGIVSDATTKSTLFFGDAALGHGRAARVHRRELAPTILTPSIYPDLSCFTFGRSADIWFCTSS